jgi:hypothetical protein
VAARSARAAAAPNPLRHAGRLQELIAGFGVEAMGFTVKPKVEDTARAGSETGERRNAVNSFQTGLSQGIGGKLKAMKAERDASNRTSTGRDLVPLKTSIIDDELPKLGLSFRALSGRRRKRVLADAYAAGQIAGYQLEVHAAIAAGNAN